MSNKDLGQDVPKREWYDAHYAECPVEPIELMQKIMTREQFEGFLMGNIIKYCMRAGHKGPIQEELAKANRYHHWLVDFRHGLPVPEADRIRQG